MQPEHPNEIFTERLILRSWRESDEAPFAAMNANPKVMEFFPSLLNAQESRVVFDRIQSHFAANGFGFWVVEIQGISNFAGFLGLARPRYEASFTPCVEVGWRLLPEFWGRGYATEGALASLDYGFQRLGLNEIVSMTATSNIRSMRVMERIGMTRDRSEDFDHPLVDANHPLCRHVLYRITKSTHEQRNAKSAPNVQSN